jgi:hypothetical protein
MWDPDGESGEWKGGTVERVEGGRELLKHWEGEAPGEPLPSRVEGWKSGEEWKGRRIGGRVKSCSPLPSAEHTRYQGQRPVSRHSLAKGSSIRGPNAKVAKKALADLLAFTCEFLWMVSDHPLDAVA